MFIRGDWFSLAYHRVFGRNYAAGAGRYTAALPGRGQGPRRRPELRASAEAAPLRSGPTAQAPTGKGFPVPTGDGRGEPADLKPGAPPPPIRGPTRQPRRPQASGTPLGSLQPPAPTPGASLQGHPGRGSPEGRHRGCQGPGSGALWPRRPWPPGSPAVSAETFSAQHPRRATALRVHQNRGSNFVI